MIYNPTTATRLKGVRYSQTTKEFIKIYACRRTPNMTRSIMNPHFSLMKIFNCFTICLFLALHPVLAQESAPTNSQTTPSVRIRWNAQPNITRYRLQIALDEQFGDIVVDRAVNGTEYVVRELAPGRYFWRIAPAVVETGRFSVPLAFEVSASSNATVGDPSVLRPSLDTGWRTATGTITHLVTAPLRTTRVSDVVAIRADGGVYVLDGASGIALWTTRFNPGARRAEETSSNEPVMKPVIIRSSRENLFDMVVAYAGGVRALEGASGRELWRAEIPGRIIGGCSTDSDSNNEIYIVASRGDSSSLYVIDGRTGRALAHESLDGPIIGITPLSAGSTNSSEAARRVLVAYSDGVIETRTATAERSERVRLDTRILTPPVIAQTAQGARVIVGTGNGLIALDTSNFRPAWRVGTEGTLPRGTLSVGDTDADGDSEVVMITETGRAAMVNTSDGRIRWFVDGANGAESAAFADLNGDGMLDVLLASAQSFASGYLGQDGTLVWRAEENSGNSSSGASLTRSLAIATYGSASVLVGNDPTGATLRAVALPRGAVRTASN
jgi:hypothetical protein